MVWDATPGELAFIATAPASPKPHQDGLANVLEEVAAFGDPDQLPQHHRALRDMLVDLKDRIGRYGGNQQRMHELFLRELGNVRGMLATGEVVSDRRVSNLTGALDTTALDIRTTNADVMASHVRRIAGREAELSPEKAVTLREIAGEIAQRGNAEVKGEIGTDIALVAPVASDRARVLRANKDERISAMDRTTRRLPEALIVMKDAGVELAPRIVDGATKGHAFGQMLADLMDALRPFTGL